MREVSADEAIGLLLPDEGGASTNPNQAFFDRLARAGIPTRELKAANPSDPVVKSLGRVSDVSRTPGAVTQGAMSFATNPEQQARIGARMGADIAGVRIGSNGKPEGVTAEGVPFPLQAPFGLSTLPGWAARATGELPTLAGGVAGGMAAGPGSLVVGPVMAGAGSAAGDMLRQGIAAALDSKPGFSPDLGQTLTEGAMGAGGQLLGAGVGRMLAPANPGLTVKEVGALRAGPTMDRARAAYAAAQAEGVPLTPGQATGLPSLLAREDVAARSPWGMDTAAEFYGAQGEALDAAGRRLVAGVSPAAAASKTDAALQFAAGAGDAATEARRMANAAARPFYQTAEQGGPVRFGDLAPRPTMRAAIDNATATHMDEFGTPAPAIPNFRVWDSVKKSLDDMVREAEGKGRFNDARVAGGLRDQLVQRLDDVYPTYAQARATAAPGQKLAATLSDTAAGRTADAGIDERARSIVAPIFQQSNPEYIKLAREAFDRAGQGEAWNAGLGAFIKDEMERASTSATGLNASMLRRNLIGKEDTRAALEAAMTPEQFTGFTRFMDTVENVARTFPQNSLTQPRAAMAKQMEGEAATGPAVRAGQALTYLGPKSIRFIEEIGTRVADWGTERNLRGSLDYLFTPDGLGMLEALAKTKPGTQNALNLTGQVMARAVSPARSSDTPTAPQTAPRKSVEQLLLQ